MFPNFLLLLLAGFDFCKRYVAFFAFSDVLSSFGVAFENKELTNNSNVNTLCKYDSLFFFSLYEEGMNLAREQSVGKHTY